MNWPDLILHPDDRFNADQLVDGMLCTREYALGLAMERTRKRYALPNVDLALAVLWRMRAKWPTGRC